LDSRAPARGPKRDESALASGDKGVVDEDEARFDALTGFVGLRSAATDRCAFG
jgi:hypothetical protein